MHHARQVLTLLGERTRVHERLDFRQRLFEVFSISVTHVNECSPGECGRCICAFVAACFAVRSPPLPPSADSGACLFFSFFFFRMFHSSLFFFSARVAAVRAAPLSRVRRRSDARATQLLLALAWLCAAACAQAASSDSR